MVFLVMENGICQSIYFIFFIDSVIVEHNNIILVAHKTREKVIPYIIITISIVALNANYPPYSLLLSLQKRFILLSFRFLKCLPPL